ncbi:MAG: hypothetical protein K0Q56_1601 [Sporolactobacillus laevolacticus]|jgi:uncharacterized membrane protein (DUF441 family)|nr:hypothetical protein [Sporolactobacillus laevolacticus]
MKEYTIYRVIVSFAIIIFIISFISQNFFHTAEPYGNFIGLMLLCIAVMKLIDDKNKREK